MTSTILEETTISETVTRNVQITEDAPDPTPTPEPEPITKTLTGISVTTNPTKVSYIEGETFDKTGMVVTASYSDGTSAVVNSYTYTPTGKLTTTDTKITITYTEGNVTKTAVQTITVTKTGGITPKDSTTANKVISQTGITNTIFVVISIVLLIGIVSYIKYKKYKEI